MPLSTSYGNNDTDVRCPRNRSSHRLRVFRSTLEGQRARNAHCSAIRSPSKMLSRYLEPILSSTCHLVLSVTAQPTCHAFLTGQSPRIAVTK